MAASTVADVDTLMRKLLGDTNPSTGDLYTDAYNLEYIQSAYRDIARFLRTNDVTLLRKQATAWELVEGVTSVWYARVMETLFQGAGIVDDLTFGGVYTGKVVGTYVIDIDVQGAPDSFQWSYNGNVIATGVAITGTAQALNNGVTITFGATAGHTFADNWTGQLLPADFLRPLQLREVGSVSSLNYADGFLPPRAPTATLQGEFDWRDNALWFIGATDDIPLQMQYEAELPALLVASDLLRIPDGLDAVAYLACALAANARGQGNDVKFFVEKSERYVGDILASETKTHQPKGQQVGA